LRAKIIIWKEDNDKFVEAQERLAMTEEKYVEVNEKNSSKLIRVVETGTIEDHSRIGREK